MKTKIVSKTYLRDVENYEIKIYFEDEFYISIKKLIKCREKFIIADNLCVMDDGYYILEILPKNEEYAMRLFLDRDKKPLEYYFDICRNIRIDEKYNIPMYDDLYLDVTYLFGKINVLDEDELLEAYKNNEFTEAELNHIYEVKDRLIDEINNNKNKCMNMDYSKYINNI